MTITMESRIKYLSEECKVLECLLNERDQIIDNLEQEVRDRDETINNLQDACNDYNNLMRECIFDQ